MKFHEHTAKAVLAKYGIPVPRGQLVTKPDQLRHIGRPVAVKAQVLAGGRGKAGGIKMASTTKEAREAIRQILGMTIGGYEVRQVLVEEKLEIERELYLSITVDRSAREPIIMASSLGGMEIESVPDEKIFRAHVPVLLGVQQYHLRALQRKLELSGAQGQQVADVARKAYEILRGEDAELVEINPLAITKDGRVVAGDAKITIDDNAIFRHAEYADLPQDLTALEQEARSRDIAFIQLDGDIGVIANGAGLTMATLDILNLKNGKGGIFLDLGGTDDPGKVQQAFSLLLRAKPRAILLNIFGGITKCDTVALGVKEVLDKHKTKIPVVARIKGVNEREAKEILRNAGIVPADTIEEAAEAVVRVGGK